MHANILEGLVLEAAFAEENNVAPRTVREYRGEPDGLPYLKFGGRVYIPVAEAREWLLRRVRRPNQRRRATHA